jgi:hypothetical protein
MSFSGEVFGFVLQGRPLWTQKACFAHSPRAQLDFNEKNVDVMRVIAGDCGDAIDLIDAEETVVRICRLGIPRSGMDSLVSFRERRKRVMRRGERGRAKSRYFRTLPHGLGIGLLDAPSCRCPTGTIRTFAKTYCPRGAQAVYHRSLPCWCRIPSTRYETQGVY